MEAIVSKLARPGKFLKKVTMQEEATTEDTGEVIRIGLSKEKMQEIFENQFGVDSQTRTRKQWKNLVKQYGYDTVALTEKMTKAEVKAKCKN